MSPGWIEIDGALTFFNNIYSTTPAEVARKFELWACTRWEGVKLLNLVERQAAEDDTMSFQATKKLGASSTCRRNAQQWLPMVWVSELLLIYQGSQRPTKSQINTSTAWTSLWAMQTTILSSVSHTKSSCVVGLEALDLPRHWQLHPWLR